MADTTLLRLAKLQKLPESLPLDDVALLLVSGRGVQTFEEMTDNEAFEHSLRSWGLTVRLEQELDTGRYSIEKYLDRPLESLSNYVRQQHNSVDVKKTPVISKDTARSLIEIIKPELSNFTDDFINDTYFVEWTKEPAPPEPPERRQTHREEALQYWYQSEIDKGRFEAGKPLELTQLDVLKELQSSNPECFHIDLKTTFRTFWRKQKIVTLKSGRRPTN